MRSIAKQSPPFEADAMRSPEGGAIVVLLVCLTAVLVGCDGGRQSQGDERLSAEPAMYGEVTGRAVTNVPPARSPLELGSILSNAPMAVVQTELSPAVLVHSKSSYLGLFAGMEDYGLGAPSHIGFSSRSGPRAFARGEALPVIDMEENWLVVWFAGARGWTNWDSPWAVFMQRKPLGMILDEDGLHIQFTQAAGDVVMMPLYGYEKLPLSETNRVQRGRAGADAVNTKQWSEFLPRELLMRVRYWASATREFPVYCHDTFRVDRSSGEVEFQQRFDWHSIRDDWGTRRVKVAPLSPPLALAIQNETRGFPATISRPVMNFDYATPYGPYVGVEGVDQYEVSMPVLRYVNEWETPDPVGTNGTLLAERALERLREVARVKFDDPAQHAYDHGGMLNFCWAVMGDQWYAKALPYYDAVTQTNALSALSKYFREDVLVTHRFLARTYPPNSGRSYLILEGPGIGSWGQLGDAGKFSANLLETLWAYAHYTGDWGLIKERWSLIKRLFTTPAEIRWVGFGRDAIAEIGDEAGPCLAMARMAYRVGDLDTYQYACSVFARELVHHYLKQRGAAYFQDHQPWHSMETMEEEVYLTNLWGDSAGWQIDGPEYPSETPERQYANRWVRFGDASVARFHRDYLWGESAQELDRLTRRWEEKRRWHNDSHILPSLVHLRSLLLQESPAHLARWATPEQFTGPPSGIIASALAMIRTSHPPRYRRLIPAAPPGPFVTGVEREVPGPNSSLMVSVLAHGIHDDRSPDDRESSPASWPWLSWWKSWRTPTGHRWNFGRVQPMREAPRAAATEIPLNWNTRVLVWREER